MTPTWGLLVAVLAGAAIGYVTCGLISGARTFALEEDLDAAHAKNRNLSEELAAARRSMTAATTFGPLMAEQRSQQAVIDLAAIEQAWRLPAVTASTPYDHEETGL